MISLYKYINNIYNPMILSDADKSMLLQLDREYGDLILRVRDEYNEKDILNMDSEMKKFLDAYYNGEKYFPILKTNTCKYETSHIVDDLQRLKSKFIKFNHCFLSKYYIEVLDRKIKWCKYQIAIHKGIKSEWCTGIPDRSLFEKALELFKKGEYKNSKELNRTISASDAKKMIEIALEDLGYDWKVSIEPNMLARMNVLPNKIIRINKSSLFNEADIEGLIAHEIKGHIGRRYWGYKTGLNLFVFGLEHNSTLDEGLAVWNSINLVEHEKPNVMINITLKYIIGYLKYRMDFYELFDYIKTISEKHNISDEVIFKSIIRSKRESIYMDIMGGKSDDCDYFLGYELVKNMTDEMRDDILKYNIGYTHINDIQEIKKFLNLNKFI